MAEAKKVAKKPKDPGMRVWVPKEKLTGGYILGKVGKVTLRGGTYMGMAYLSNRPKIAAGKIRPWIPAMAGLAGIAGEIFLNPDNLLTDTLKGVAEGLTTYALVDGATQLFPETAKEWQLNGLGYTTREPQRIADNSGTDWAQLARELAERERTNGMRDSQPRADVSGLDDDEDDDEGGSFAKVLNGAA